MTITSARRAKYGLFTIISGLIIAGGLVTTASVNSPQSGFDKPPQSSTSESNFWRPGPKDRLQIQFSGMSVVIQKGVEIYDLDLFDTDKATIESIQATGAHVICYINAGSWEDWRPDAGLYPGKVIGKDYEGWPGEKWLDIRRIEDLKPILSARFDLCKEKGFEGVEPDNLDGYQNETGFVLTPVDQLTFNSWLASMAHSRGLAIGLKNDPDQMDKLAGDFDFAVMEECLVSGWCDKAGPFIKQGKPAYSVEYTDQIPSLSPYCDRSDELGVLPLLKNRLLDAYRSTCD